MFQETKIIYFYKTDTKILIIVRNWPFILPMLCALHTFISSASKRNKDISREGQKILIVLYAQSPNDHVYEPANRTTPFCHMVKIYLYLRCAWYSARPTVTDIPMVTKYAEPIRMAGTFFSNQNNETVYTWWAIATLYMN